MPTSAGRLALEARRLPSSMRVFTLLNGLEADEMRRTHDVLQVIRLRLERYENDRRRALSAASARR